MKKWILPLSALVFLSAVFVVAFYFGRTTFTEPSKTVMGEASDLPVAPIDIKKTSKTSEISAVSLPIPTPKEEDLILTLSAVGDCTLGTDPTFRHKRNFLTFAEDEGFPYFFENVLEYFESDDLTIANLEGTFTESTNRADKKFAFKAPPEFAEILTVGSIEAVNLANNHTYDFGKQGFEDTIEQLEFERVEYFYDKRPIIIKKHGVNFGLWGMSAWSNDSSVKKQIKQAILDLREQSADFVILSFHWGIENTYKPNVVQKNLAHYAIDNGADVILGHHPHVLQPLEIYKSKPICYSLGNFSFGGNSNPSDKDTVIFQQQFIKKPSGGAIMGDYKLVPCSISSTQEYNDFRPTPVEGDAIKKILKKLGVVN